LLMGSLSGILMSVDAPSQIKHPFLWRTDHGGNFNEWHGFKLV
jgi:hypothetical protein